MRTKANMNIGISSYTFPQAMRGIGSHRMTAPDLLTHAKALGVQVCQYCENANLEIFSTEMLHSLRYEAEQNKIRLEVGIRATSNQDILQGLAQCQHLGANLLRIMPRVTKDELTAWLRNLRPRLKDEQITIAIENHESMPAVMLRATLRAIDSEYVGACFDTANSIGCFENAEYVLDQLQDEIVNIHIKDIAIRRKGHSDGFLIEGTPAGQGMLPLPNLLSRLKALPRPANFIIEHWCTPEGTFEATLAKELRWTQQSVAFLRTAII